MDHTFLGKSYSEDACRKLNGVPVLGVPIDQVDQGYQCSKTAMISAIGLMNAVSGRSGEFEFE